MVGATGAVPVAVTRRFVVIVVYEDVMLIVKYFQICKYTFILANNNLCTLFFYFYPYLRLCMCHLPEPRLFRKGEERRLAAKGDEWMFPLFTFYFISVLFLLCLFEVNKMLYK